MRLALAVAAEAAATLDPAAADVPVGAVVLDEAGTVLGRAANRRDAAEGALDDLPLDRVRVLEFVDQHDVEAIAQNRDRVGATGTGERGKEPC